MYLRKYRPKSKEKRKSSITNNIFFEVFIYIKRQIERRRAEGRIEFLIATCKYSFGTNTKAIILIVRKRKEYKIRRFASIILLNVSKLKARRILAAKPVTKNSRLAEEYVSKGMGRENKAAESG